jgi:hypothetical protein
MFIADSIKGHCVNIKLRLDSRHTGQMSVTNTQAYFVAALDEKKKVNVLSPVADFIKLFFS